MDPTQLYAAAAGGLMSLLLILSMIRQVQQRIMCLARLARHLGHLFQWPVYFFLKHFVYSFIVRRTRFSGPFSRSALVTQVIYWAGTAVCNSFRVTTAAAAGTLAGELAVVNFAVLLLGGKFEFLADLLGVGANSYRQVHQTVSLMTCLQSLIHILLNTRHGISLGNPLYLFGLLASAGMASLLATAVLKRLWYGVLAKLHFLLGLFTLVVLWRHLQVKKAPSQLYLLIGSVLLFCSTVIQWFLFALRNVSTSGIGCKSRILRSNDGSAAQIIIPLFRHFKVRAGMNVYLWLPGLGYGSTIQKHPFPIAWWEEDERGLAKAIILLVKTGPGNTILSHDSRLTSFIQGPYGRAIDFAGYDRVLMVATGMGIAAQLPYLKELVMMKDKKRTTRQLYVVWQLEEESHMDWVYQWMTELLRQDQGTFMLKFGLYLPSSSESEISSWNSEHDRIWKIPTQMNPAKFVRDWWAYDGKTLITVSAHDDIHDGIREVAKENMTHVVDIVDLPFQSG